MIKRIVAVFLLIALLNCAYASERTTLIEFESFVSDKLSEYLDEINSGETISDEEVEAFYSYLCLMDGLNSLIRSDLGIPNVSLLEVYVDMKSSYEDGTFDKAKFLELMAAFANAYLL